ncbi:hypothetical protein [Deinococcus budaensis]|uniref:PKD repeat protein n=1 Tax=Deinococcus budaensis TaxID=1665626 RepID=A0A7W8GHU4_9DEIO|nr:hypothetical protein [Deinococcus budaensis]MBB5235917.1 PKD repeat protein [Deinococcus budaensis]
MFARRLTRSLALLGLLSSSLAAAAPLVVSAGGQSALQRPAVRAGDSWLLPLREVAARLGVAVHSGGQQLVAGRLTVFLEARSLLIDGVPYAGGLGFGADGEPLIEARLLAYALGAQVSTGPAGELILTPGQAPAARPASPVPGGPVLNSPAPDSPAPASPGSPASPAPGTALPDPGNAPQARFVTSKATYAPGEQVQYTDYSFDPEGLNLARQWSGAQPVFFQPGEYPVTLTVTNSKGARSAPLTRVIRVQGATLDTPLTYALRHTAAGQTFADPGVMSYPALTPTRLSALPAALVFSDSPEAPTQPGVLYRDRVSGRVRVVAYHLNRTPRPARLYVLARASGAAASSVQVRRDGSAAPTRLESVLGQVSVLDFLASGAGARHTLGAGEPAVLYASPTLQPGQGAKVLQDLEFSGPAEITTVLLEEGTPPSAATLAGLPVLPPDANHQRGTFPEAVRSLQVTLGALPARLMLGDGVQDPPLSGVDATTGAPQRLMGNYGLQYDLTVQASAPAVVGFVPRGGPYRGAAVTEAAGDRQFLKIPASGMLSDPNTPLLLRRLSPGRTTFSFIPSGGSFLPVVIVFYPQPVSR